VGEVLDLSKIEANSLEIEKVQFSDQGLLDEIKALMSLRAKERGIDLLFEYDVNLLPFIVRDPILHCSILVNLIGNALKFTERGFVCVKVMFKDPNVEFSITDSGIGIQEDQRRHLFQPFMQADSSMTRKYGGTGLGLMLSKQLAKALGGD